MAIVAGMSKFRAVLIRAGVGVYCPGPFLRQDDWLFSEWVVRGYIRQDVNGAVLIAPCTSCHVAP